MKSNYKYAVATVIIAVSLLQMNRNADAQAVYRNPNRPALPYSGIFRNQGMQNARQSNDPWMQDRGSQQYITLGIHFDPLISWFSTQSYDVQNQGSAAGYNFGLSYNRYFGPGYSFSSGINIISAGGRLVYGETTSFEFSSFTHDIVTVQAGEPVIYRMNYVSVPFGLKLEANHMGYGSFFADLGFDPKILVSGKADIPSENIMGYNAMQELRIFNISYHMMAGVQYPFGAINKLAFGIGFENNFLDVTRNNTGRPWDMVSHKMLSFRIGLTF